METELISEIKSLTPKEQLIIIEIIREYHRACDKHPIWPQDLIYQQSIITEESGELNKSCNELLLEGKGSLIEIHEEAVQIGAMSLRFCNELGKKQNT